MKSLTLLTVLVVSLLISLTPVFGYDLGAKCEKDGDIGSLNDLWGRYEKATNAADYRTAIEIRKKIILVSCDNPNFWEGLPELHLRLKDNPGALAALEEMYLVRHFDIVDRLFDTEVGADDNRCSRESKSLYVLLKESAEFKQSKLADQMKHNREQYIARQKQFRDRYQKLSASQMPGKIHVTNDACPGEGCQFGLWTAKKDTALYDKPKGNKVVNIIKAGEQVKAVTGRVYVRPLPIGIIHDLKIDKDMTLHTGDLIFELEDVGEGWWRYWKDGKEFNAELGVMKYCPFPGTCYAEYLFPDQIDSLQTWWVKIEVSKVLSGWTKESQNFSGTDAFE